MPEPTTSSTSDGFSITPCLIQRYGIVGLLLGGSNAYRPSTGDSPPNRDWDGLILVKEHRNLLSLISDPLAISTLMCLPITSEDYLWWREGSHAFEAIRICGHTASGVKKSVKILSCEKLLPMLEATSPRTIDIMSQKNVRVYPTSYCDTSGRRIQEVTSLSSTTFLLHDADIYLSAQTKDRHSVYASFGCTMDMLLTGKWVYETRHSIQAQRAAMCKYRNIPNVWIPNEWSSIFSRQTRFPDEFRRRIEEKIGEWDDGTQGKEVEVCCEPVPGMSVVFWGPGNDAAYVVYSSS